MGVAFPPTPFKIDAEQSQVLDLSRIDVDEWPSGAARGRSWSDQQRYGWKLVIPWMSHNDRLILDNFINVNRNEALDFTDRFVQPAVVRTNCFFDGPVVWKRLAGKKTGWAATVSLRMR